MVMIKGTEVSFLNSINESFLGQIFTEKFMGRAFSKFSSVEIQLNEWATLGRRIATTISDYPFSEHTDNRSFDDLGHIVNLTAHNLLAKFLKIHSVENSAEYINRVNQATLKVFEIVKQHPESTLKQLLLNSEIRKIDVPNNKFSDAVTIESENNQAISQQFTNMFVDAFVIEIIGPTPRTLEDTSLRAILKPEIKEQVLPIVKKLVSESGLLKDFDQLQLKPLPPTTMILERGQIQKWVHEAAKEYRYSVEEWDQMDRKAETPMVLATETIFKGVLERMENFKAKNPTLSLQPDEL